MGDFMFWVYLAQGGILLAVPIALAALGELIHERTGVLNIGVEGVMLFGAFFAIVGSLYSGNAFVGLAAGVVAGLCLNVVLAVVCVIFRGDQVVLGIALVLFALGVTNVLSRQVLGPNRTERVAGFGPVNIPVLSDIPVIGPILFQQSLLVYATIVIALLTTWVINRTPVGLTMRAAGEAPAALVSAGISVIRVRVTAVLVGGMLAGAGGAALALQGARLFNENMTAGRGFIAIAALVVGRWRPIPTVLACLGFGVADYLQLQLQAQTFLAGVPAELFLIFPYVLTIVMLGIFSGRRKGSPMPSHLGIPWRGGR